MLDVTVLPAFVAMILMFLAPPGPDMMLMVTVGLQGGRAAALKAIAGIGTGMGIYAAAVVLGLGFVADRYPALLSALELIGAGYLFCLAWSSVRHAHEAAAQPTISGRWYGRGLAVSLTNPKLMLFFAAVLPDFRGHAANVAGQLALLGAVNITLEVVLYGSIGVFAAQFRDRLTRRPQANVNLHRVAAVAYALLASFIAYDALRP